MTHCIFLSLVFIAAAEAVKRIVGFLSSTLQGLDYTPIESNIVRIRAFTAVKPLTLLDVASTIPA
jgi:hypothetical protein